MTFRPDEWARVKELFEGALALAPSQRSSFIASACGDDDALRRQVEELLASPIFLHLAEGSSRGCR